MAEYEIVPLKWKSSHDAEVLGTAELNVEPDDVYMSINKETYEKIRTMLERSEQEPKTDSTSIPDDATNGDVFTIMFNKTFPKTIVMYKNDESMLTISPMFSREWWEMPYKESEE